MKYHTVKPIPEEPQPSMIWTDFRQLLAAAIERFKLTKSHRHPAMPWAPSKCSVIKPAKSPENAPAHETAV